MSTSPLRGVRRSRTGTGPAETIDTKIASCTGLSILLVDACRSVGVPARLVGIASWPHKRGNHTWVEVWDGETWRFTGAAEQDPAGFDRGWFVADAALARSDERQHAIHAVQWRRTGTRFPLAWARDAEVHAIDVTSRYTASTATDGRTRLGVDVLRAGQRVVATVELFEAGASEPSATGRSKDRHADRNDHLEFRLEPGRRYRVRVTAAGQRQEVAVVRSDERFQILAVALADGAEDELRRAAERYFAASATERAAIAFPPAADEFVRDDEERARAIVAEAWRGSSVHAVARADFAAGIVRSADREARYSSVTIGERQNAGHALVIAMHGGGGVPPEVNDRQWEVMKRYYRPQPDAGGYRYVALRAPNDEWNGFYDDAIGPLVVELIRQHILFGDVDPDRVFAIGYSHGGYGAFVIGPKLADRFAAVHASAAAPTPGETLAVNLRNLRFSCMIGSQDRAYERIVRCDAFAAEVALLRKADPDGYRVRFDRIDGHGHGGLPDRNQLADLLPIVRDPVPRTLVWAPSDARIHDHFWLRAPGASDGQVFRARAVDGEIELETSTRSGAAAEIDGLAVGIDRRLIGEHDTFTVRHAGRARVLRYQPTARGLVESLARRGDPRLAFPMWVDIGADD